MKRVAAASGEGATVVPLVHAYLADRRPAVTRSSAPRRRAARPGCLPDAAERALVVAYVQPRAGHSALRCPSTSTRALERARRPGRHGRRAPAVHGRGRRGLAGRVPSSCWPTGNRGAHARARPRGAQPDAALGRRRGPGHAQEDGTIGGPAPLGWCRASGVLRWRAQAFGVVLGVLPRRRAPLESRPRSRPGPRRSRRRRPRSPRPRSHRPRRSPRPRRGPPRWRAPRPRRPARAAAAAAFSASAAVDFLGADGV